MLNNKKTLILIACAVVAVVLICIVLVGLINGVWPWQYGNMDGTYTGMATSGEEETGGETQDATASDTVDPTQTTAETEAEDGTKPSGSGDSGNKPQNPTKPSNPEDPTIDVEIEDPAKPTEVEQPGGEINFDDLLAAATQN